MGYNKHEPVWVLDATDEEDGVLVKSDSMTKRRGRKPGKASQEPPNTETLQGRIKARRLALVLTQKVLGERVGVSAGCIAHWELGMVQPSQAVRRTRLRSS